jgi:hypothetical protein
VLRQPGSASTLRRHPLTKASCPHPLRRSVHRRAETPSPYRGHGQLHRFRLVCSPPADTIRHPRGAFPIAGRLLSPETGGTLLVCSYCGAHKGAQGLLVDLVALMEVYCTSCGAFQARIEKACGVFQRSAPGESHLHDALVRLAGADQSMVRPHRDPSPPPSFDDLGIGFPDESAEAREHLASPVAELLDSRIYQPRRGFIPG